MTSFRHRSSGTTSSMLQRSAGRTVEVEIGGSVVRKTFAGDDPDRSRRQAEIERDRLQRFADALLDVPGAACPRPIDLLAEHEAVLRMEHVPGRPLLELLRAADLPSDERTRIADAAATGLARYIDTLGEAYEDFQFDNMLFDAPSATLAFVDLGSPDGGDDESAPGPPLQVSLGNLVGSTMFQSARPKWLLHRRQHRQAADLCAAVVNRLTGAGAAATVADIVPFARDAYVRSAFGGGWSRRTWYGSVGYLVAHRPAIAGVRFTPPRGPGRRPSGT